MSRNPEEQSFEERISGAKRIVVTGVSSWGNASPAMIGQLMSMFSDFTLREIPDGIELTGETPLPANLEGPLALMLYALEDQNSGMEVLGY